MNEPHFMTQLANALDERYGQFNWKIEEGRIIILTGYPRELMKIKDVFDITWYRRP